MKAWKRIAPAVRNGQRLALDVQRFLNNEAISARPPSKLYRFQKILLRNKLCSSALASSLCF